MSPVCPPFRMVEILKAKTWGGRRLETLLGKALPDGAAIGESWEVSDVGDDVTIARDGAWAGRSLRDIAASDAAALYGPRRLPPDPFPLLAKILHATEPLSIQVHPDDETAARLGSPSGKTEAWVVIHAEPGATIWRGLTPGCTREEVARRVADGTIAEVLHAIPAAAGDAVLVTPGSVHAIGGGLVLYEIQQAADVTYRLDDWGRVGADGQTRPLQVEEGLAALDLQQPCLDKRIPARLADGAELLVACDKFTLCRWTGGIAADAARLGAHCVTVIAGRGQLTGGFGTVAALLGTTLLVPHAAGAYRWEPEGDDAVALCASCPALETATP